jgi:hypothetical protein
MLRLLSNAFQFLLKGHAVMHWNSVYSTVFFKWWHFWWEHMAYYDCCGYFIFQVLNIYVLSISPWSCWSYLVHFFLNCCWYLVPTGHIISFSSDSCGSLFSMAEWGCRRRKWWDSPWRASCWTVAIIKHAAFTITYILVSN